MGRKPKIDTKEAIKLKLKGVSTTAIAKMQGVSQPAMSKRLKPLLDCIPNSGYMAEYQDNQADILDALASGIIASVSKKDLSRASLLSKVNSMAVLIDRSRLIRGQSTSNSVSVLLARHVHANPPAPSDREVIVLDDEV